MNHFTTFVPFAVAAGLAMAFATSASADYVTTTTGGAAATPTVHAVSEGHLTLKNPIANIGCNSTTEGTVTDHGPGKLVSTSLSMLNITGCTNSWHTTTNSPGLRYIEWTSGHDGTVVSDGVKVTATRFGVTCVYETKNTHLATMTGGNPATLHVEASIPINPAESSGLCGTANSAWEGGYTTTSALYVVNS